MPSVKLGNEQHFQVLTNVGHTALRFVVSVVLLCINNSASVATSNKLHRAETRLTVPNVGVGFLVSAAPSTKRLVFGHLQNH